MLYIERVKLINILAQSPYEKISKLQMDVLFAQNARDFIVKDGNFEYNIKESKIEEPPVQIKKEVSAQTDTKGIKE